jgi:GNAT superfamily N-acetyltransferase
VIEPLGILVERGEAGRCRRVNVDTKVRLGDLNFVESLREQTRAAGGQVEEREGVVLMRGSHRHPLHNNVVRLDPSVASRRVIELARSFYADRGYGFIIALLNGQEGSDLASACESGGLPSLVAPPAMFVERRLPDVATPDGCTVRALSETDEADFVSVSCSAWATYAIPAAAVTAIFAEANLLRAPHVRVVVGYEGDRPSAAAMVLLSHGIAGVYWVGTIPSARGKGLAEACTRAVTNLALDAGAQLVTLQASPMGEPIYRRMGYEVIGSYRLFVSAG